DAQGGARPDSKDGAKPERSSDEPGPKITESNADGKALAAKVVAAMGGEAKLASVKSTKASLTLTRKTPQGDVPLPMETIVVFPDHLHADMQTPGGNLEIVVTPDAAFMAMSGQGAGDFHLPMETIVVFPDHLHADMQTPGGNLEIVVTPDAAFMAMSGQGACDF